MDKVCAGVSHWSIINSAATNSQLAGVLAGFQITVIAVLFASSRKPDSHTVVLFASGVLVLGLDSFLFSLITGTALPETPSRDECAIVWSQGVAASGMLAVGGAVLVCGLGWMLVSYGQGLAITDMKGGDGTTPSDATQLRIYASVLNGCLSGAIVVATMGLLMSTTIYYLRIKYAEPDGRFIWAAGGYGGIVIIACAFIIIRRTRRTVKTLHSAPAGASIDFSIGRLPQTTYGAAALAVTSTIFAGLLTQWAFSSWVQVTGSVALGLFVPGIINFGIAASVADAKRPPNGWQPPPS